MRLRLRVERNELPSVSVLWAVEDTQLKQTVAQFLERVNERFPLEGESWGLEEYAVTVGGYEALHYNEVGTCFQHEDEVVIKPLQFVDLKARMMTGRDQISRDGRHLHDGIPFGRPLLKRPRRPDVHIPARKRKRLEEEEEESENEDEAEQALIHFEQLDEQDDAESDMEYEEEVDDEDEDEDEGERSTSDNKDDQSGATPSRRRSRRLNGKTIASNDGNKSRIRSLDGHESSDTPSDDDENDDSSSEESDDDSVSSSDSSEDSLSKRSSDASSGSSSNSDDDTSSENSWNGIRSGDPAAETTLPVVANGPQVLPELAKQLPGKPPSQPRAKSLPYQGEPRTKIRNARRRDQRQLKHLKESGLLPAGATMTDMKTYLEKNSDIVGTRQTIATKQQRLLAEIAAGGIDVTGATSAAQELSHDDDDGPPDEEPILAVPSRTIFQDSPADGRANHSVLRSDGEASVLTSKDSTASTSAAKSVLDQWDVLTATGPAARQPRKHIDVAGVNRMVFGSLGVRTPKNEVQKEALQKKLVARAVRQLPVKNTEQSHPSIDDDEDPEAWRNLVEISAVECCDEDVVLSTPPFPFQQRWDPQYQKNRYLRDGTSNRKRRKWNGGTRAPYVETYDKYNPNGGGDALNYDDEEEDDGSYWEDGALLDDDYGDDEESEQPKSQQVVIKEVFPPVPDDISTLPLLSEDEALVGDFVVSRQLFCSATTNWEPGVMARVVRLERRISSDSWLVKIAPEERRPKLYDENGKRVYDKFEVEEMTDDEDDEREDMWSWESMEEPRLLQRAGSKS